MENKKVNVLAHDPAEPGNCGLGRRESQNASWQAPKGVRVAIVRSFRHAMRRFQSAAPATPSRIR